MDFNVNINVKGKLNVVFDEELKQLVMNALHAAEPKQVRVDVALPQEKTQAIAETKAVPAIEAVVPAAPQPVTPAEPPAVTPPAPETPQAVVPAAPIKEYTLDELLAAASPLMDAGKMPELQALMQKYGVPSMFEIPKERYGELATDLRALGARV